jgi:hypothetical protein
MKEMKIRASVRADRSRTPLLERIAATWST